MSKIDRTRTKLQDLKRQKTVAEQQVSELGKAIDSTTRDYALCYEQFFTTKINKEFVLYNRFPETEALGIYTRYISNHHPLNDYGDFNIKELAEIIRYLYQEIRQDEYQILTMGMTSKEDCGVNPHLYFKIGSKKALEQYKQFNGQYFNKEQFLFYSFNTIKDFISIEARACYDEPSFISSLTGNDDVPEAVNFGDYIRGYNRSIRFSLQKNIFASRFSGMLSSSRKTKGIKSALEINIHKDDSFLANILVSITIYKRNNGIKELTEQDYNHIFEVLFGHPINIAEEALKDIPKSLIYVPRT